MRKCILTVLATAVVFAGLVGAAATPAAAVDTWINQRQVLSITNPKTALSKSTSVGTVQVRYGNLDKTQYGWGRALNIETGYMLVFEIDTDGNRVPDYTQDVRYPSGSADWTWGYRTSPNSDVAFRACITKQYTYSCASTTNRTAWW